MPVLPDDLVGLRVDDDSKSARVFIALHDERAVGIES